MFATLAMAAFSGVFKKERVPCCFENVQRITKPGLQFYLCSFEKKPL